VKPQRSKKGVQDSPHGPAFCHKELQHEGWWRLKAAELRCAILAVAAFPLIVAVADSSEDWFFVRMMRWSRMADG